MKQLIKDKFLSENKSTLKPKIKAVLIFLILLSTFCEILEVIKIKAKKKQIHYQEITSRNNYYLGMIEVLRKA